MESYYKVKEFPVCINVAHEQDEVYKCTFNIIFKYI